MMKVIIKISSLLKVTFQHINRQNHEKVLKVLNLLPPSTLDLCQI
ncbi:MAG: hypothetical protein ACJAZ3_001393 [Sphingobacteriales bacterium]|jgi:hypothetical protein